MRGLHIFALLVAYSTTTESLVLQRRTDGEPKVLSLDIQRRHVENPLERDKLRRRSGTVEATLDNEETLYFANVSVGTPAQNIKLHIDTGSSDLWVNTPKSALCQGQGSPCKEAGTYTANSSSTYNYVGSYFNISYVDGSNAAGDYATDTLEIGGTTLTDFQFGIGYTSTSSDGIMGIGYQINEVQAGRAGLKPYNNLPAAMVAQGMIQTNSFSLWLNDLDANTGNILFGGVDTEKFTGTLSTLPVQPLSGNVFAEFLITLTGLSLGGSTIAENQNVAVLLDSGSSLTYLPNAMVSSIYSTVGAQYSQQEGAAFVPCSLADSNSSFTLDFTFTSPTISVPMDELVLDISSSDSRPLTFSDGTPACLFGIAPVGSNTAVLGDTFIRSAYLVYDLANNQVSIAQTKFNASASNILEIAPGASGVPSATLVQNAATATQGLNGQIGGATVTVGGLTPTGTGKSAAGRSSEVGVWSLGVVAGVSLVMGWL